MSNSFSIKRLLSGGLITNYYCTSKCAHCLYACSPKWDKEYISPEQAKTNFQKVQSLGCFSVHIGGGEPFLNFQGLLDVLDVVNQTGMGIDYIETNSSWYNEDNVIEKLQQVINKGVTTLLISISPFHNEHIPYKKVKGLIKACQKVGMGIFPWVQDFMADLNSFDDNTTHALNEYEEFFGRGYLASLPNRYWTHYGGRAISTFKKVYPSQSVDKIINSNGPCRELASTDHFHIDLFGNYVPGLCSGFSIKASDLGKEFTKSSYPLINTLYHEGIGAFCAWASKEHNYTVKDEYLNKCDLCLDIRRFFVKEKRIDSKELQPVYYYSEV